GGINTTLRDLARFGFVYANRGRSLTGQQVAPTTWIGDTLTTSEDVRQAFADGPGDNRMPGGAYHNQFWFPFPDSHAFLALGIHGQMIYMNPGANVLRVKLSSWGLPQDAAKLFPTIRAFEALAMAVNSPPQSPPVSRTITPPLASQRPASAIVPRRWQLRQSLSHHVPVLPHPPGAALGHASEGACRPAGEGTARWARPLHGRRGRGSRTVTHANVCPDRHIRCRTRTQNCERRQPAMADSLCRDHVCDRFTAKERDHDTEPPHHPDAPPADSGRRNSPDTVTERLLTAR